MGEQTQIVFFHIGSDFFGGASKMLLRLLQSLDQDQFDLILLSNANDELCKRARNHAIEVKILPFRGTLDTYNRQLLSDSRLLLPTGFRIFQFNWEAYSYLRDADVIWCKNLRAVLTLAPYVSVTRTPTIWNIGLGLESKGKVKYMKSIALRIADHVFIESENQARRIFSERQYKRHREQFTVFHKGVDTDKFDPTRFENTRKDSGYRIGTAASLTPRKGLEYLIDSLPMVLQETENVTLLIAGRAPKGNEEYKEQLKERIQQHSIEDSVELLGWVEDMPNYLDKLDVFVLPSHNEGIPGAVREALAMEVPCIATSVGGISNVIIDGETGLLTEPGDSEAIAEGLTYLLNNPTARTEMGARGREYIVSEFSVTSYIRNYEQFLERIATD